jgi:hypothetical protein
MRALWNAPSMGEFTRSKGLESKIQYAYTQLCTDNPTDPDDRAEQRHRDISCMMLAAYVSLKDTSLANALILDTLQHALSTPNSWIIKAAARLMLREKGK